MTDLIELNHKSALVSGGSRGIGEIIATGFVANGAKTYISSRHGDACDVTAARLSEVGECVSIPCDLSSMDCVKYLASALAEREETLDILVNSAGATRREPLQSFPERGWDKIMAINLKAPFFLTKALLPLLKNASSYTDPAPVINIDSIDGLNVNVSTFSYGSSKTGFHHLTRMLAANLAPVAGIGRNPGWNCRTRFHTVLNWRGSHGSQK